jgi:D-tyrosyl-tRNA(Tyr) deacylase
VTVDGVLKGSIQSGLLVYLGVALEDTEKDADWLAEKILHLRIFNDADGKMNLSLFDVAAESESESSTGILAISQFTLLGDARKGRRPSWNFAAPPEKAKKLYEYFITKIRERGVLCANGEFQAHMKVTYTNDGPVTILLDSEQENKRQAISG